MPQHDTSPTTPSPFSRCKPLIRPSDPAIDQYWRRLHVLLRSAHQTSSDLRPLGIAVPPTEKAVSAHIAFDLQGRFGCECDEQVKTYASKPEYLKVYTSRAVGDFVEYGVQGTHAVWVVQCLASVGLPLKAPKGDTPVIIGETHADLGVEEVRVRVFEAEVSCLPLPFLERLLKVRKTMRRFKQRIDLCTRILLALEGRGRRVAQPGLDKLKLSLEKADMLAGQERVKGEAAEAARVSKEKKSRELARVKQEKAQKVSELKKRKRQENAQASFMMRFVKPKSGDSHETDRKSGSNHFKRTISETNFPSLLALRSPEGVYAANIPSDLDVMSASWWLRCLMNAVPQAVMDNGFSQSPSSGPLQPSSLRELLLSSANRRRNAEGKIHALLKDYRRQRKIHIEDRTPRFVSKRKTVRGVGLLGAIKLLQFDENHRPAFFGTLRLCSSIVCARRPFAKDNALNYTYDSEDDWEEEDEGEDLVDVEAEKELDNEDAELRKLYGSDEEDDDDFLDDEDADEDDEEELDNEGDITMVCSDAGKVGSLQPSEVSENRPISDINVGSNNPEKNNLSPVEKRTIVKGAIKRNGKRRKRNMKQSVVIHGMEPHNDGVSSSLASYPVTMFGDAPPIQMFNPFVYNASDIVSEHLKSKPPSVPRVMRPSSMDDSAKLDLAIALMRTGSSKDKIILQFCERRKIRGLQVPAKSEILRALGEIARREKRDGDTRAGWYLNDKSLAQKVEQMSTVSQETSEIPFVHEPSAVGE